MARSSKSVFPSKKTINLAVKEKSQMRFAVAFPLILLILAAAAAFSKYGVYDRFEQVRAAEAQVASLQAQKDTVSASLTDYDEVEAEYKRFSTKWMTDAERESVDRTDMLSIVEEELANRYKILNESANGNIISLKIAGANLSDVAKVVTNLNKRSDVTNVEIFNATNKEEHTVTNDDGETETVLEEVISIVITTTKD